MRTCQQIAAPFLLKKSLHKIKIKFVKINQCDK